MEVRKIEIGRKCFLVAVVDEEETVITAGAFKNRDEADTAANMLFTFITHQGLNDIEGYEPPNRKLAEVCESLFQNSGRK
ncbi:MAG: hypothetical protein IKP64_07055 [Selenomonadaceae bacterium]|nr:hypothetical protein [Selenomonadaceae bacterium]MBR4383298.1 hypothetical protein [Selenomonadaceae bacterium]